MGCNGCDAERFNQPNPVTHSFQKNFILNEHQKQQILVVKNNNFQLSLPKLTSENCKIFKILFGNNHD